MSITRWAGNTLREFRHALRMLRTKPAFSGTVILTLALGMGATTAIFSVVNGVIIKPLPYPDSDEVVIVMHSALFGTQRSDGFPFSPQMLEVYAAEGRAFEEIGILRQGQAAVTGDGDPNQANTLLVSQGILPSFGVAPMLGRWFSREDDQPGAAETAVLSYGYWQARLGGDRNVIGRTLTIDGRPREVIGVMPAGMPFYLTQADIVLPLQIDMLAPPPDFDYAGMARLKPGFSVDDANADIARMLPMYIDKYTGGQMDALELQPAVRSFKQNVVGNVGQVLWLLLGSISILLLIACANVANLLLVRTETRGTELAVRTALGAGPGHLARGLIVESLTLSLIGGLAGVGLALVGLPLLLEIAPAGLPRLGEITIDVSVLVFAFGVSILAGLFFGLFPVLKLAGQRFVASIGEFIQGGRWSSAGKRQQRSQNTLVVVQVALALVMLVGSGLMLRTFQNLRGVEPGFTDPSTIQTARVSMPDVMFGEPEAVVRLQTQIRERLAAIPGVTSAAYISSLPMEGIGGSVVYVRDKTYAADEVPPARRVKMMSPGLLRTFGTPLLVGRDFEWIELEEQRNVAMVSASFARAEWGTVDGALGRFIRIGTTGGLLAGPRARIHRWHNAADGGFLRAANGPGRH
jgi:putative ABC transport system permease protein